MRQRIGGKEAPLRGDCNGLPNGIIPNEALTMSRLPVAALDLPPGCRLGWDRPLITSIDPTRADADRAERILVSKPAVMFVEFEAAIEGLEGPRQ
jgi:hypothetical protein